VKGKKQRTLTNVVLPVPPSPTITKTRYMKETRHVNEWKDEVQEWHSERIGLSVIQVTHARRGCPNTRTENELKGRDVGVRLGHDV
jgi:hypothetical protein